MASEAPKPMVGDSVAHRLFGLIEDEGSAAHAFLGERRYLAGPAATRNLADATHNLSALHGIRPGVIDLAAERSTIPGAAEWLDAAVGAFVAERALLTKLVVAAGPLPSTPGQAQSETAVIAQRHALEMLARSDRVGCALGAAIALVEDWRSVRMLLDAACDRFGLAPEPLTLPDPALLSPALLSIVAGGGVERALRFGAQQLLIQHRGHWDLLETRIGARSEV